MTSDNQRIVGGTDMHQLKLYNAAGTSQTAKGRVTQIGFDVNMATGQMFPTKKYSVGFHISDFSTITGSNENYKNWQGEFLNSEGETVKGRFNNPLVDKTFGYVVATLVEQKA
jgi:hypothetical protein